MTLALTPDELHLWRVPLALEPAELARLWAHLDADERARAVRFRFARDGDRFVAAHGALRAILARYLDVSREELRYTRADRKPRLDGAAGALRFNLSHADDQALIAVTCGREVGVDIQRLDDAFDASEIATRYYTPGERAALSFSEPGERARMFFAFWTLKEAYFKGTGKFLPLPPEATEFAAWSHGTLPTFDLDRVASAPGRWWLAALDAGAGYLGAVALAGPAPRVRWHDWSPGHRSPAAADSLAHAR